MKTNILKSAALAVLVSVSLSAFAEEEVYDTNFALTTAGSTITASSNQDRAANAIDDNIGSSWESEHGIDDVNFVINLGQQRIFNTVQFVWEGAYGKHYKLLVSNDGTNFTEIKDVDETLAGFPHTQTVSFEKQTAQYLKWQGIARGTQYGYNLFEIRVFLAGVSQVTSLSMMQVVKLNEESAITVFDQNGNEMSEGVSFTVTPASSGTITNGVYKALVYGKATVTASKDEHSASITVYNVETDNLALNQPATAGFNNDQAGVANDGNAGNRWGSSGAVHYDADQENFGDWWYVDLGAKYNVLAVRIKWETARPNDYDIRISDDFTNWTTLATYTDYPEAEKSVVYDDLIAVPGRYIGVWARHGYNNLAWGISMYEFEVYGQEWVDAGDTEKPVMGAAVLVSKTWNSAIISVAATDNSSIASFRVVDATNSIDKKIVPAEDRITITGLTAATAYNFTITAIDAAGNESENNAQVSLTTDTHLIEPDVAAPVPTWPDNQVIVMYSDAYTSSATWTYLADWWQATQLQEKNIEGDHYLSYTAFDYLGWDISQGNPINALNMEKLHVDIWSADDAQVRFVPIYGGENLVTNDNIGKMLVLTGQQWNSFDFELATDFATLDFSSIFQFKFDQGTTAAFCVDNAYFYRTTPLEDTEKPQNLTASVAETSYFSVTLALSATDNMGAVNYIIKRGEEQVATGAGVSGATVNVTVPDLLPATEYTFSVIASDGNENVTDAVQVTATTQTAPASAPVPTLAAEDVKALYSDVYELATIHIDYRQSWWNSATLVQGRLTANDNVLFYTNIQPDCSHGWAFDEWDATGFPKLHFSIYPLAAGTINLYPVVDGQTEAPYHKTTETLVANQWNEVVLDYTDMVLNPVKQIGWNGYQNLQGFFIDNVYFFRESGGIPTALETGNACNEVRKVLRDGQIIILRDNKEFTVTGIRIK